MKTAEQQACKYSKIQHRGLVRLLHHVFGWGVKTGAEVGVYKGELTEVMLDSFPDLRLTLVDPWRAGITQPRAVPGDGWIKFSQSEWDEIYLSALSKIGPATHRCRVMRMTSAVAASLIDDKSLDFVFIDADHVYESVKQDIELWLPKAKRLICGHDYGGRNDRWGVWGVKRAVDEMFGDRVMIRAGLIWAVEL